ncbi:MAG TPA: NAD-dependent epimerase/dehydratase family protein, partial [Chloroflexota bacterium]|nr:NAD-dependent epimerase/dehydratase family protein [Chloroflexota bacterium]
MKILIPGGSGHLGQLLTQHLEQRGHEVVVLSRTRRDDARVVEWDGRTLGSWAGEVDGADAVINLAGRSVNCRYSKAHLTEMLTSRVDSTRAVGMAIAQATHPPRTWLQASTATIYAHTFDRPNDEVTGRIGGDEPGVPAYWRFSVEIAKAWEEALLQANTLRTRKVALRTAMVMSAEPGGVFDLLCRLARWGLGGSIAGGEQFISWVHEQDFVRAIDFLLD